MKASEANRLAKEVTSIDGPYMRAETDAILKDIEIKARRGEFETWYYRSEKVIQDRLSALGYKLQISNDQRDGYSVKVSW